MNIRYIMNESGTSSSNPNFLEDTLMSAYANYAIVARSSLNWENYEYYTFKSLQYTLQQHTQRASSHIGPVLPFDTLLLDVSLSTRYWLAHYSSSFYPIIPRQQLPMNYHLIDRLNIGLFSCDFHNHPTSHMILGIFRYLRQWQQCVGNCYWLKVQLIVYSYGNTLHDSYYRQVIMNTSHAFIDVSRMSDGEIIHQMKNEQRIDILLEMQVHTLGNRLEVTATRPAPSIINFLVYPGTSGASFIDHLYCDGIVVPLEHVVYYTEKLFYVPASYQISYYNDQMICPDYLYHNFQSRLEIEAYKYELRR
jgi:protein O-GlcNAc transferase